MILDVNGYFGSWPYWPMKGTDPNAILEKMDRYGIDRVFLNSLRGVFTDPEEGNAETLRAVESCPDRFSPALTFSPYHPGYDNFISLLKEKQGCLLKLFPLNHSYQIHEEPRVEEVFNLCGERKIPVLIPYRLMMSWRLPIMNFGSMGGVIEKFPQTHFILGSINYLFELQTARSLLRRFSNTSLETSAMMAYREVEKLVAEFGAERFIHGSCIPLQNPAIGPLKIKDANISDEDKEKILSGNLLKLMG
ncbi:MAG: amidohydrolase family protein [Candidatus Omnitrophica bacterium]|nr:amidohydrolase family protein [Candidatus Omnitrophota bacterium]